MKVYYPLLVVLLALAACGNDTHTKEGKQTSGTIDQEDTVKGSPGAFYKRFSGTLGDRQIVLNLEQYKVQYAGAYYDLSTNRPVKLMNNSDAIRDNHYSFVEIGTPGKTGRWELTLTGNTIKGTRIAADSSVTAVNLQETYPEGSWPMAAFYLNDTGRLFKTLAAPKATAEYGMLWPRGTWPKDVSAFAQSRISMTMNFEGNSGVDSGLMTRSYRYFSGYRNELRSVVDTNWPEQKLKDMAYNYSTTFYHHVVYNDHNWLVLEDASSDYTGGAHGMYHCVFQNLDMKTKRDWRINQVITDTAALKPYLELAVRDYFGIKSTEDLSSRLLTTEVPVTANFYITPAGLTFVYNPYELASYSDGEVHLFLPFDKIMNVLTGDFKTRMNFNPSTGVAFHTVQNALRVNYFSINSL